MQKCNPIFEIAGHACRPVVWRLAQQTHQRNAFVRWCLLFGLFISWWFTFVRDYIPSALPSFTEFYKMKGKHFWDKFQKRLKLERSQKLMRKRKNRHSLEDQNATVDAVLAKAEDEQLDNSIESADERELKIDSLLHVLEEYVTSSISPKNQHYDDEQLANEIDTLSIAVQRLKREMLGLDSEELVPSKNAPVESGDEEVATANPRLQLAIQALDDLSKEVPYMTRSEEQEEYDQVSSPGNGTETTIEALSSQSFGEVGATFSELGSTFSEEFYSCDSFNADEEEEDDDDDEDFMQSYSHEVDSVDGKESITETTSMHSPEDKISSSEVSEASEGIEEATEPLEQTNSEHASTDADAIDLVDEALPEKDVGGMDTAEESSEEREHSEVPIKVELVESPGEGKTSFNRTDDDRADDDGAEETEMSSDKKRRSPRGWKEVFARRKLQDEGKSSFHDDDGVDDGVDTGAEPATKAIHVQPVKAVAESGETANFDIIKDGENSHPQKIADTVPNPKRQTGKEEKNWRRKHRGTSSPTKDDTKKKKQQRKERKKEKKRTKRFITYKDELARLEEAMKKERPKFSMSGDVTLVSKAIKYLRAKLLQQAKDEAPNPDPLPPKLMKASLDAANSAPLEGRLQQLC
jgi:hypothetical protein